MEEEWNAGTEKKGKEGKAKPFFLFLPVAPPPLKKPKKIASSFSLPSLHPPSSTLPPSSSG